MRNNRLLWPVLLSYLAGLGLLGFCFRNALNTDAVAYLRLASYYAGGKWSLAISGYWGPLASWWMAPFLKLGLPPLLVARGFMMFSALIFLWGCLAVYRAFQLPRKWFITGAILSALAGLYWSVQFITPDLLLAGLIGFAVSRMLAPDAFNTRKAACQAGLWWALAYLTKAVALPVAVLATLVFGAFALRERAADHRLVLRNLGWTLLALGLAASPWIITLSLKYQAPTFSTTPRISHTLTGPPDVDRYHPFARAFQVPEAGRITSWEEPSRMAYREWSPLESPAYAWHQVKVIARNILTCLALLTSLNLCWLALPLALAWRKLRGGTFSPAARSSLRALVLPAALMVVYVPCYVTITEQRFFFAACPFLFAGLALWANADSRARAPRAPWCSETVGWWLVVFGAFIPWLASVWLIGVTPKFAGDCAADLARRMKAANLAGPIAGSGSLPGGRAGLYVAFLLDQPWYGDEAHPSPASFETSGARLVLAVRHSRLAAALDQDSAFRNLDARLFASPAEADRFPLEVYQVGRVPIQN